ncbi:hypothetical protein A374_01169 [Fictibacillus macauensis ZFHKF-1]|uniref:Uncharacterized protein n=1 Tax=Fictibacillus macauensis ZFHKF-1 TaxID=1196324 RepID=I8J619_9BACL|nr:WXG100 family type VII secretion target [Fictibacillus macauensis]EIT87251.1 hypothetical protein A374_01169 [Fictibacillus macauensis ZFHKF-1]
MENLKIDNSKLIEAWAAAGALEKSLTASYEECDQLLSYLNDATWSGKSRDAFVSFIEIIKKYHKSLKDASHLNTVALEQLKESIDNYSQYKEVVEVKNL